MFGQCALTQNQSQGVHSIQHTIPAFYCSHFVSYKRLEEPVAMMHFRVIGKIFTLVSCEVFKYKNDDTDSSGIVVVN